MEPQQISQYRSAIIYLYTTPQNPGKWAFAYNLAPVRDLVTDWQFLYNSSTEAQVAAQKSIDEVMAILELPSHIYDRETGTVRPLTFADLQAYIINM